MAQLSKQQLFARNLKRLLRAKKLTVRKAAEVVELPEAYLSRLSTKGVVRLSVRNLEKLRRLFDKDGLHDVEELWSESFSIEEPGAAKSYVPLVRNRLTPKQAREDIELLIEALVQRSIYLHKLGREMSQTLTMVMHQLVELIPRMGQHEVHALLDQIGRVHSREQVAKPVIEERPMHNNYVVMSFTNDQLTELVPCPVCDELVRFREIVAFRRCAKCQCASGKIPPFKESTLDRLVTCQRCSEEMLYREQIAFGMCGECHFRKQLR